MKKSIFSAVLCLILAMALTACSGSSGEGVINPATANAIIGGGGEAIINTDDEGNSIIENLSDGNHVEWIVQIEKDDSYKAELEYSSENKNFSCKVELYSEQGRLVAQADMDLKGTGALDKFNTESVEMGEVEKGLYTLIIRPNNKESKSINIKSVKLIP